MRTSIRSVNAVVGYGESVNARVRLAVFLIEPALDDPDAIEIGAARIRQRTDQRLRWRASMAVSSPPGGSPRNEKATWETQVAFSNW